MKGKGPEVITAFQIYALILALFASLSTPLPFSLLALTLLVALAFILLRKTAPTTGLAIVLAAFFLLPRALEPLAGWAAGSLLTLPLLALIDHGLRELAPALPPRYCPGRTLSPVSRTLFLLSFALSLVAGVTSSPSLALLSLVLFLYTGTRCLYTLLNVPRHFIDCEKQSLRIMAGNTMETEVRISGLTRLPLLLYFKPCFPGATLQPGQSRLAGPSSLKLTLKPTLSGPTSAEIEVAASDPWGLLQLGETVKAVDLLVIPRARVARWLVLKYLEGAGLGSFTGSEAAQAREMSLRRGIEYSESRYYQPGDSLKDIDWKHSLKLHELIIKERREAPGQRHIVLVNLEAADVEEADRLVYALLTALLTIAREGLPASLSAYKRDGVSEVTPVLSPRELLLKGLEVSHRVVISPPGRRFLAPPYPAALRRLLEILRRNGSSFKGLRQFLELEAQAVQRLAQEHPAAQALHQAAMLVPPPATVTIVSSWSYDAAALNAALDRLRQKGYRFLKLTRLGVEGFELAKIATL